MSERGTKEQFPKIMEDILAFCAKNPELVGLVSSIGAIALGAALALDDAKDFGKLGDERDPPVPHHWEYGILLLAGGVAGTCASGVALLKKLPKPVRKKLPPGLIEQGAPPELVERYK